MAGFPGAVVRDRTADLLLTMEMLYQLSYNGIVDYFLRWIFSIGTAVFAFDSSSKRKSAYF
jgi:hypothetical protein